MKYSLLLLFLAAVICAPGAGGQTAAAAYDDPEAYAVYSALFAITTVKKMVIQTETTDYPDFARHSSSCLIPAEGAASPYAPVIVAYNEINKKTWLLQRKFDTRIQYELVSKAFIEAFFKKKGNDGWKDFYDKYPDSGGPISLSAVGFNTSKTLAIVYVGHSCGWLCGGGTYHALEKKEGKWAEVEWNGETCSWAS